MDENIRKGPGMDENINLRTRGGQEHQPKDQGWMRTSKKGPGMDKNINLRTKGWARAPTRGPEKDKNIKKWTRDG